jgi:glycine/D-amino acid oxidase-like deaminating enzyme
MSQFGHFSVLIAGGGLSGMLLANRLQQAGGDIRRIAMVDKNPSLGGRLGALVGPQMRNTYGLQVISYQLMSFLSNTLRDFDPWLEHEQGNQVGSGLTLSLFAGNKLVEIADGQLFSKKVAQKLGGMAAAKGWEEALASLRDLQADDLGKPLAKAWSLPKKSGPSIVLDMLGPVIGLPDIWVSSAEQVLAKMDQFAAGFFQPDWALILEGLQARLDATHLLMNDCRILRAVREDDLWHVETEKGFCTAEHLAVCQNPWDASDWVDDHLIPNPLISYYSKTQAVSLVSLWAERLDKTEIFAKQMVYVPSEQVELFVDASQLAVHAAIPFEMSMDAPNVVKAIKRLKRGKRKLEQNFPELKFSEMEHLALLPTAWPQSPQALDRRYVKTLTPEKLATNEALYFCGDAYGPDYDGDLNLLRSVVNACDRILASQARTTPIFHIPLAEPTFPLETLPG